MQCYFLDEMAETAGGSEWNLDKVCIVFIVTTCQYWLLNMTVYDSP